MIINKSGQQILAELDQPLLEYSRDETSQLEPEKLHLVRNSGSYT
jgi:hypothetical protein